MALFTATHIPIPEPAAEIVSAFDKFLHGLAFFILAVLTVCSVLHGKSRISSWIILTILLIGFAALDEYLQQFVNRYPDVNDWIADSVGILTGCAVMFYFRNRLPSCSRETLSSQHAIDTTLS
ncbi:MAG TPA: VanZ family protein [Planctomicrobium sp.]|nr:VanZ family protein [Planctomicrobium sp.]